MSFQDYMKTFAPPPEELTAMDAAARKCGANKLTPGQINRIIATVRRESAAPVARVRGK